MTRDIRPQSFSARNVRLWAPPRRVVRAGIDLALLVAFFGIGLCVVACIHG